MKLKEAVQSIEDEEVRKRITKALFGKFERQELDDKDVLSYYSENGELKNGEPKYEVRDKVKDPCHIPEEGDEVRLEGRRENRGAEDYIVDEVNVMVLDNNHQINVYLRENES